MNAKTATRIAVTVAVSFLLLVLFETGLAAGEPPGIERRDQRDPNVAEVTSDAPCDRICEDESCEALTSWDPIVVTDVFAIYPITCCLCENEDNSLRVEGKGGFFLPNIPAYEGLSSLQVAFVAHVSPTLEPVCIHFTGTSSAGIPIGQSGLKLTYLEGEATLEPEPRVNVTGTIVSGDEIPFISPIVEGTGAVAVDLQEPYAMEYNGIVTILTFKAAEAALTIDQTWGLAGSAYITVPVCHGESYVHVWKKSDGTFGFTGSASLTCALTQGSLNPPWWPPQWYPGDLPDLPPTDVATIAAQAEIGEFCLACQQGRCAKKTYGLLAGVGLDLPSLQPVVEPGMVTARFFVSPTGISSVTTNLELPLETHQSVKIGAGARELSMSVEPTELAIFVVAWQQGQPNVSLINPLGAEVTASARAGKAVARVSDATSTAFLVRDPQPGRWRVRLSKVNGDEGYTLYLIRLNDPPAMAITSPSSGEEESADSYTIHYTANDPDDEATVSLYYDRDKEGHDGRLIAHCLPEGEGSYVWDTSEVGTGNYFVYGRIDDGKNFPVVAYSEGTVHVEDVTQPATPAAPALLWRGNSVELAWEKSPEDDVVGYYVHHGDVYTYDATNVLSYRLPYDRAQPVGLSISAYDSSGNRSGRSDAVKLGFVYLPTVLRGLD